MKCYCFFCQWPYKSTISASCSLLPSPLSYSANIPKNKAIQLVMQLLKCASFLLGVATLGSLLTIAHRELLVVADSEREQETRLELNVEEKMREEIRNNLLTGQKMVSGDVMEKMEAMDDASKPSPGAKYHAGKCGHGERMDLSMNCHVRSRKLHPGVNFDGHIPFTADYYQPHNHPPKNN